MSILIKGMEMPPNCDKCRIMTYENTNCISVHELYCGCPIVFKAHPQHEEHRPDYCPLVEIVYCKDCRWGKEVCGNIECWTDINVPPEYHGYEWFCPNGERRSE